MMPTFSLLRIGIAGFCAAATLADLWPARADEPNAAAAAGAVARPVVNVVEGGESKIPPEDCRATLVGPGVNQPDPFPGYTGFVGWSSPVRLQTGDWLVGFSAGYWHASPPTPLRYSPKTIEAYRKLGMPEAVVAPTGGRAMIIRSSDEGRTWSKPTTLLDTPADDRHPAFVEMPDGTLLCSVFVYPGVEFPDLPGHPDDAYHTVILRSHDHGHTWDKDSIRPPTPFLADETDGPIALLKDGTPLLTISGANPGGRPEAALFASADRGASWNLLSVLKTDHELEEANTTELPDGRWVLMARREGDIAWSSDRGHNWTAPVTFGMRIYAPSLYVLADGTLVCLHGSSCARPGHPGLRLIFSSDGGQTLDRPGQGLWLSGRQLLRLRQGNDLARRDALRHRSEHRRHRRGRRPKHVDASAAGPHSARSFRHSSVAGPEPVDDKMPILGSHLSIAGGYYKAVERAHAVGCNCVQLFTNKWRVASCRQIAILPLVVQSK